MLPSACSITAGKQALPTQALSVCPQTHTCSPYLIPKPAFPNPGPHLSTAPLRAHPDEKQLSPWGSHLRPLDLPHGKTGNSSAAAEWSLGPALSFLGRFQCLWALISTGATWVGVCDSWVWGTTWEGESLKSCLGHYVHVPSRLNKKSEGGILGGNIGPWFVQVCF